MLETLRAGLPIPREGARTNQPGTVQARNARRGSLDTRELIVVVTYTALDSEEELGATQNKAEAKRIVEEDRKSVV